jgi:hypothetical protein
MKIRRDKRGTINVYDIPKIYNETLRKKLLNYVLEPRHIFLENGDRIKLGKNQEIIEVFSPR